MKGLRDNGYDIQDLPESAEELMQAVIHDAQAQYASPELNVVPIGCLSSNMKD